MTATPEDRIRNLGIWSGAITIEPLSGGMTNRNYLVRDARKTVAVRFGEDIDFHMISRANELAASLAAHAAGISPEILHHAPGILVMDYIEARTFSPADIDNPAMIQRIIPLLRTCHLEILQTDEKRKYFRPCLLYAINQCTAPCADKIGVEPYAEGTAATRRSA